MLRGISIRFEVSGDVALVGVSDKRSDFRSSNSKEVKRSCLKIATQSRDPAS
jgi:hypothetical protein